MRSIRGLYRPTEVYRPRTIIAGADPGFQVRGAHLKKLRRAEGGANIFGVFRVKNHDITPKNLIFSNFRPPPWIHPCNVHDDKM